MIKPKVGYPVLYNSGSAQPCPALICFVHNDTCVNIGGFTEYGQHFAHTSVVLNHGDDVFVVGQAQYNHAYTQESIVIDDGLDVAAEVEIDEIISDDIADDEIEIDSNDATEVDSGDAGE